MDSSAHSLLLLASIVSVIVIAAFGVLFVLDVIPREQLQEALVKVIVVIAICLAAALAIWGILKISRR